MDGGGGPGDSASPSSELTAFLRFREHTAITTYTVVGGLPMEHFPTTFGPHEDRVRTLP